MAQIVEARPDRGVFVAALVSLFLYWAGRSPFAGQWDSFDYLRQIVTHRLSDLGFGRPVFIGYNIAVWEALRWIFRLAPESVEAVAKAGVVLAGVIGVLLFRRLSFKVLSARGARLSTAGFLLSPVYALYAGYVMTEVPMLAALLGAATLLWPAGKPAGAARSLAAGVLFGAAVGIREQAVMLAPAFLWILWQGSPSRPGAGEQADKEDDSGRLFPVSVLLFGVSAALLAAAPVGLLYFSDPVAFAERVHNLREAVPTGAEHVTRNFAATVFYGLLMAPGTWIALAGAALVRGVSSRRHPQPASGVRWPAAGVLCGLVIPLAMLWRDADVQIHPRYVLIALPASILLCAALFDRWLPNSRAALAWGVLHLVVFGAGQFAVHPFRQMQADKRDYARSVLECAPPDACLVAGAYSPVFDYYRAIGVRPDWRILWSGWGWSAESAAARVRNARSEGRPILLCDGPWAWLYFEDERLDLHRIFSGRRQLEIAPGLKQIGPRTDGP